jgi:hypothetical protein
MARVNVEVQKLLKLLLPVLLSNAYLLHHCYVMLFQITVQETVT